MAHGIPNIPTKIAVPAFKPIWKFQMLPIKLMIKIRNPPKTELIASFPIAFSGIEKILPMIYSAIMQPMIIKILEMSKFYHLPFHTYDRIWTNITYPT